MAHESPLHSLTFETDAGLGNKARIGLIVLQTDQTVEHEIGSMLNGDGVAIYHARIPNAMDVTPQTLEQMEAELPAAAALLPRRFDLDAIGYCCTSGATMIGEQRIDEILQRVHPAACSSNPLTACKAALNAMSLKRIALVTPYVPTVTNPMRENLTQAGFEINAVASFDQSDDFVVARISSRSIARAVETIGARDDCDGVFVSCTSLRTLPIIAQTEVRLRKPVISSNQALGWHLMRLTGLDARPDDLGELLHKPLPSAKTQRDSDAIGFD